MADCGRSRKRPASGARARRGLLALISVLAVLAVPAASANAAPALPADPVSEGALTNDTPVTGTITSSETDGIEYTFNAVAGTHLTLAITDPLISSGDSFNLQAYDSSGASDTAYGVNFNTGPVELDFTPSSTGSTRVVITPNQSGASGSFTLTYATDVTGTLTSGVPVTITIPNQGQHAVYTFNAVDGQHATFAVTNPHIEPTGDSYNLNVQDPSQAWDSSYGVNFSTNPVELDFTPDEYQAGASQVVITPNNSSATGSFTLTYATDANCGGALGALTSGVQVSGSLQIAGQDAICTFNAVANEPVALRISSPNVSPPGDSFNINAWDSSGAADTSYGANFSTSPAELDFTPDAAEAGPTTVVISPNNGEANATYALTYIAAEASSTSVNCSPGSLAAGDDTTCTATVTDTGAGAAGVPSGTVSFTGSSADASFGDGSCTLTAGSGAASSCTTTFSPSTPGSYTISGAYGGDAVHNPSSGTSPAIPVNDGSSTSVSCEDSSVQVGTQTSCTATVTDTYDGDTSTPSGSVSFAASPSSASLGSSGTCALSGSDGTASCSVTFTPASVNDYTLTATYGGDTAHGGSSGTSDQISAYKSDTSTSVSCSPSSPIADRAMSCTARVDSSSGAIAPTGTVTFHASPAHGTFGGSGACSLKGSSTSSKCTVSFTPSAAGTYTIKASYGGDQGDTGSNGSSDAIAVKKPLQTGSVAVARQTVPVAASGVARIKLDCGTSSCAGAAVITVSQKARVRTGKHAVTKTQEVTIGKGSFSGLHTGLASVSVKLNGTGLRLLRTSHGKLTATVTITLGSGKKETRTHATVTLTEQRAAIARADLGPGL